MSVSPSRMRDRGQGIERLTAKARTAILISGRGSNMRALIEAARAPDYPAEIVCVISNRPEVTGLARAAKRDVKTLVLDHTTFETREAFDDALHRTLTDLEVEFVACAGFMRLLTPAFVEKWRDRMLNIHPSLLPAFRGLHTHERALEAGVKITGCTVHLVRPEMDDGPIIAQAAVPVLDGDTPKSLGARVLAAEHRLYPHALQGFLSPRHADRTGGEIAPDINSLAPLFSPPLTEAR